MESEEGLEDSSGLERRKTDIPGRFKRTQNIYDTELHIQYIIYAPYVRYHPGGNIHQKPQRAYLYLVDLKLNVKIVLLSAVWQVRRVGEKNRRVRHSGNPTNNRRTLLLLLSLFFKTHHT